jgi:lipopolysaccharide export system permease protein
VPLGVIAMLVIALPFAFSSQRAANAGQRLFIGIVLGIVFLTLSRIINYLGPVYGLAPFLSAALPPALFLLLGLVALKRQA